MTLQHLLPEHFHHPSSDLFKGSQKSNQQTGHLGLVLLGRHLTECRHLHLWMWPDAPRWGKEFHSPAEWWPTRDYFSSGTTNGASSNWFRHRHPLWNAESCPEVRTCFPRAAWDALVLFAPGVGIWPENPQTIQLMAAHPTDTKQHENNKAF